MAKNYESLTCHRKGPGSIPGWSLWDFFVGKIELVWLFFEHFGFSFQ